MIFNRSALLQILALVSVTFYCQLPWWLNDRSWNEWVPPYVDVIDPAHPDHLGVEHLNVAKSICQNGSFANPFKTQTGSTAWIAPLFPSVLAVLLWCSNQSLPKTTLLYLAMQLFLLWVGIGVAQCYLKTAKMGQFLVISCAFILITDCQWLLQYTHDCVITSFFIGAMMLFWSNANQTNVSWTMKASTAGFISGVAMLSSPIVGLACVATLLTNWHRNMNQLILSCCVAALIMMPWIVRNYVVFDQLIPIKCSGAFEAWQAQCKSQNGLVTFETERHHPCGVGNEGELYTELGERAYINLKQKEFFEAIAGKRGPTEYVRRCTNRFAAASVWYYAAWPYYDSGWFFVVQRVLYPFSFIGFLLSFLMPMPIHRNAIRAAQVMFVFGLMPYIFISFYHRYTVPLFPLRIFFTGVALGWMQLSVFHWYAIVSKRLS